MNSDPPGVKQMLEELREEGHSRISSSIVPLSLDVCIEKTKKHVSFLLSFLFLFFSSFVQLGFR